MKHIKTYGINALSSSLCKITEAVGQVPNLKSESGRAGLLAEARAEVLRRVRRKEVLGHFNILNDPAWDILLELYISDAAGNQLYASVVGSEAGIPQSTALRWLSLLEKQGLLRRRPDVFDKRRQWVGLTPKGRALIDRHFAQIR